MRRQLRGRDGSGAPRAASACASGTWRAQCASLLPGAAEASAKGREASKVRSAGGAPASKRPGPGFPAPRGPPSQLGAARGRSWQVRSGFQGRAGLRGAQQLKCPPCPLCAGPPCGASPARPFVLAWALEAGVGGSRLSAERGGRRPAGTRPPGRCGRLGSALGCPLSPSLPGPQTTAPARGLCSREIPPTLATCNATTARLWGNRFGLWFLYPPPPPNPHPRTRSLI